MNIKDIVGYEGLYQVSNTGTVIGLDRVVTSKNGVRKPIKRREIAPRKNNRGYLYVRLNKDCKTKVFLVHRLVAAAFIDNPDNLPQANHLDGNKLNNHSSNLEWTSASGNTKHAFKHGLNTHCGCGHTQAIAWVDTNTGVLFCTIKAFSEAFGIPYDKGHDVLLGKYPWPNGIDSNQYNFKRWQA